MSRLAIHLPERIADKAGSFLRETAPGLTITRLATRETLDVGGLRRLQATLAGSLTGVRAPYAYPFLSDTLRGEFSGRPHLAAGPDFLLLGGGLRHFLSQVLDNVKENRVGEVALHPFARLGGILDQSPRDDDEPVVLGRATVNYNQAYWEELEAKIAGVPEERWSELGANTLDLHPVFAPFIREYCGREPRLIVDVGCGLGQTARTLAATFPEARVLGLDVSPQAVAVARRTFTLPNLEFAVADMSGDLGLPPGGVDLIVSANALSYAADQLAAARRLFEALSPDGLLANMCRMGPSHSYWDFPRALLLPSTFQLQPRDWTLAAAERGLASRIAPSPLAEAFNPLYYHAYGLKDFRREMEEIRDMLAKEPPAEYAPHLTHAVLLHGRRVPDNTGRCAAWASHLDEVGDCLAHARGATPKLLQTSILSWLYCFSSLRLYPEAADFIRACLPGARPMIDLVFTPETLARLAAKQA